MPSTTNHPLTIERDTNFSFVSTFALANGDPVSDISALASDIRLVEGGKVITSFTTSETSSGSGVFELSLSPSDTKALRSGLDYKYDVIMTRPSGTTRVLRGNINIEKERTSL